MLTDDTTLAMCCVSVGTVLQLYAALPNFSNHICAFLDREFPDHWVGKGDPFPGLFLKTPLDFLIWSFVKDIVYHEEVQNMNLLHDNYHSSRALCMLPVKCLQVPHVKLNIILMCVIPLMVPILRSAEDLRNFMKSSV